MGFNDGSNASLPMKTILRMDGWMDENFIDPKRNSKMQFK